MTSGTSHAGLYEALCGGKVPLYFAASRTDGDASSKSIGEFAEAEVRLGEVYFCEQ